MSMLLRLVRSQGIKNTAGLVKAKDQNLCLLACRNNSSNTEEAKKEPYEVKQAWVSYGFNTDDKYTDRHFMHLTCFITISVCLVIGSVLLSYAPDPLLRDWAQREAYLQLRYKEANGLPPVDKNLIDPSKFTLPTDEELGYTEIII